jgi:hypothetical protein
MLIEFWCSFTMNGQNINPPERMDHHEKMRIRAAAFRVKRLYPGPAGEMLSRELLTWEEFGYRLGATALVMRLVDHILKAPIADPNKEVFSNAV